MGLFGKKKDAKHQELIEAGVVESAVLPFDDFYDFMEFVNRECRGIGCGYSRRSCRAGAMAQWLEKWAAGNPQRARLVPTLRRTFTEHLPQYFRNYSQYDNKIEDGNAFRVLHAEIAASLG